MAKSDARFGYRAKLPRTDHDLSRPFGFTCCPGMELPVYADFFNAGDFLKVKHELPFLRTNPLASPAMVDVKVHFETFFVPMQMLYQPYENTMYSLNNFQSDFYSFSSAMNDKFPLWDYSTFCTTIINTFNYSQYHADCFRLADMLGLGAVNFCDPVGDPADQFRKYKPSFFPWQLLAYHTIWNYYYRLDDKTQFNSKFCNWDSKYATSIVSEVDPLFMQIHQRPWNFDYFTSSYRSPIISDANLQLVMPSYDRYSDLVDVDQIRLTNTGLNASYNHDVKAFSSSYSTSGDTGDKRIQNIVSTAAIRQIFANEKLAMITGRTRKNYDSQVLAHLGIEVPTDVKHDLQLIGHDTYHMRIGEVTSLASTSDAPLGELAGKGWATSDNEKHSEHHFKCPVDGVVMTLFSVEPLKRYYGGFERQNAVSDAFDLPVPEFDRLGNVPMFYYETGGNSSSYQNTDIAAWKERFYQWKRRAPKCTWAFAHAQNHFVPATNTWSSYMLATQPFGESLHYSFNITGHGAITYSFQYMYPVPSQDDRYYIPFNAMDDIMLTPYVYGWDASIHYADKPDDDYLGFDDKPWLVYQQDPLIVDCYPTVTKVSWMSKDGEPIYNL